MNTEQAEIASCEFDYGLKNPIKFISSQYENMLYIIHHLTRQIEQLEKEKRELEKQFCRSVEESAHKTFVMAMNNSLPEPETSDYQACGYKKEQNND